MAAGLAAAAILKNVPRLPRLFANKVIKVYPAFAEFYGMEDAIEPVVSYFRRAAPRRAMPRREQADPLPAGSGRRLGMLLTPQQPGIELEVLAKL